MGSVFVLLPFFVAEGAGAKLDRHQFPFFLSPFSLTPFPSPSPPPSSPPPTLFPQTPRPPPVPLMPLFDEPVEEKIDEFFEKFVPPMNLKEEKVSLNPAAVKFKLQ